MRAIWRTFEGLAVAVGIAACAGPTFAPDAAPEFLVTRAQAPFYRLGPQQAGPPDARLAIDDRVRMLRREFGYSFVLIATGESGYVGNEDLKPAPIAVPPPRPAAQSTPPKAGAPDLPPVEEPLPKPDLDAPPEDAPSA